MASRAGSISDTQEKAPRLFESHQPADNMTLRIHKEKEAEAAAESAQTSAETARSAAVPTDAPPSYQDVIAELPGSSTSPRIATRDDSDPDSDSEGIHTPAQSSMTDHIPGDHKFQLDTELPGPLQGILSPVIQGKVDTLLAALEEYRKGSGRRLPVKRARRDLLNQLYEDQIRNQESATGARLRAREKSAIWKDLKDLRDDMWAMLREAKKARRQWK